MEIKKKYVYLSGPMTGLPDYNRQAFNEAEKRLKDMGAYAVFNPASKNIAPRVTHFTHEAYMCRDLHILTQHEYGTPMFGVIAMLPGWSTSKGASLEHQIAMAIGLEVMYL